MTTQHPAYTLVIRPDGNRHLGTDASRLKKLLKLLLRQLGWRCVEIEPLRVPSAGSALNTVTDAERGDTQSPHATTTTDKEPTE